MIPLLFETENYLELIDESLFIDCNEDIQFKKIIESEILLKPEQDENKETITNKHKKQNNNFLKTFLVLIISFVALVLIADTFKIQIKTFYPEIDNLLNSLFQTLTDINLFLKDLIK